MTKKDYPCDLPWAIHGKYIAKDRGPGCPGKRYQVRVWDEKTRKYDTKSFHAEADARSHAETQAAKFTLEQDQAGKVTISATKDEYIQDLTDRKCSPAHVREAGFLLTTMIAAGINNLKAKNITTQCKTFMRELKDRRVRKQGDALELSPATRKKLIIQLKAFGNWLVDHSPQYLLASPFRTIQVPEVGKPLPEVFTLDECRTMVSDKALALEEGLHWALRLWTGLRKEEATWLRWEHIIWEAKRIHVTIPDAFDAREADLLNVQTKDLRRDKERLAIIPDEFLPILRALAQDGHRYVFPDNFRSRGTNPERTRYRRHLKALEITEGKRNPHKLRSTNASLYLKCGLDSLLLKRHLGHDLISTTEGYAKSAEKFPDAVREWNGKLMLRTPPACKSGATGPSATSLNEVQADDSEEDLFVLLPSTSDLLERIESHPAYPHQSFQNPIPRGAVGSTPTLGNVFNGRDLYDMDEPPPVT